MSPIDADARAGPRECARRRGEARRAATSRADRCADDAQLARRRRGDPGTARSASARLAVAGDAGDADDLAAAQGERSTPSSAAARRPGDVETPRSSSSAGPGALRRRPSAAATVAADHQLGELARGRSRRSRARRPACPARSTDDAVGTTASTSSSLWQMKMIGEALRRPAVCSVREQRLASPAASAPPSARRGSGSRASR